MRERCASEIVSVQTTFSFKLVREAPFKNFKGKSGFPSQYRGHSNDYEITSFLVTHDFKFKVGHCNLCLRGRPRILSEKREIKVANRAFKKAVIRQFKVMLDFLI